MSAGQQACCPHVGQQLIELGHNIRSAGGIRYSRSGCHHTSRSCRTRRAFCTSRTRCTRRAGGTGGASGTLRAGRALGSSGAGGTSCAGRTGRSSSTSRASRTGRSGRSLCPGRARGAGGTGLRSREQGVVSRCPRGSRGRVDRRTEQRAIVEDQVALLIGGSRSKGRGIRQPRAGRTDRASGACGACGTSRAVYLCTTLDFPLC